jgi:hypothetical protein
MAEFHLTDDQFFQILRDNAGLFARTAKSISETYGIPYSRQAARERALKQPEILTDIEEEGLDMAEGGMRDLMISPNEDIKFKSCQFVLKTKGKKRGYVERTEVDFKSHDVDFTF